MPPISVNGTIASTRSDLRSEPNAQKSSVKIASSEIGMMIRRRASARCWFSNWPPQVIW